jgi:hypothetical protein
VLFCLRHLPATNSIVDSGKPNDSAQLNPLAPYYLVFIHDDGTVRFSFVRPKESMLLFRDLAAGEPMAFESLCDVFDSRTNDGADMSQYVALLKGALQSIEQTFARRAVTNLLSGRNAVLPQADESPTSDGIGFDLVTWLVIMKPE